MRWAFAASLLVALLLPFVLGNWTPLIALGLSVAILLATHAHEVAAAAHRVVHLRDGRVERVTVAARD